MSAVDFVTSASSYTIFPETFSNSPRTEETIRCRTLKWTPVWSGSNSQGAA